MGVPFADPVRLTPLARDYSDVRIVIAHAGSDFFSVQAMLLAQAFDNVWLEPSGVGIENIEQFLQALPPDKLMFSTDVPEMCIRDRSRTGRDSFHRQTGIQARWAGRSRRAGR